MTWQETILASIRERHRMGTSFTAPIQRAPFTTVQFTMRNSVEFMRMLRAVCEARDISLSGYARRCIAVQLSRDLGMPVKQVLHECPDPPSLGRMTRGGRDEGQGIEHWCPHPNCDGSHLLP